MKSVSTEITLKQMSKDLNALANLHEDFRKHTEADDDHFREMNEALTRIEAKLDPIAEVYEGVLFSKKFVLGLSSLVLAIAAIGGGVYWLISWIRHGG